MGRKNFKIDFIGIGAEKAGTTWLADCLREHPEVCIPESKELFFFNDYDPHFLAIKNYRYERGLDWYARQFNGCKDKVTGEISPTYLYSKVAAERIKSNFPDVKIITVLREPTKRALSQYIHDKRLGVIKDVSFDEAVRMYANYIDKGLYHKHLSRYLDTFKRENILILFHEDLIKKPRKELKKVYKFLELEDTDFKPKSMNKRSNVAGKAKLPVVNYFMMQADYFLRSKNMDVFLKILDSLGVREMAKKLRDINSTKLDNYPKINKKTREFIVDSVSKDISKLEKLTVRKFDKWK